MWSSSMWLTISEIDRQRVVVAYRRKPSLMAASRGLSCG